MSINVLVLRLRRREHEWYSVQYEGLSEIIYVNLQRRRKFTRPT